jgi:hypothetical protein
MKTLVAFDVEIHDNRKQFFLFGTSEEINLDQHLPCLPQS